MRVSIITVTYNSALTLERTLRSVQEQSYADIEHIIVDGGSTDGTLSIIEANKSHISRYVSEPDRGIYDAINKGIRMATGDIIGLLHSDDTLATEDTIAHIVRSMETEGADVLYGDLVYCDREHSERVVRYWRSNDFRRDSLKYGWMPPHPTFYCRQEVLGQQGEYDISLHIAADYEFMLRVLKEDTYKKLYLPEVLVKMSLGGISNRSLRMMMRKSREDYRVMRRHHVGGVMTLVCKNLRKIRQFLRK